MGAKNEEEIFLSAQIYFTKINVIYLKILRLYLTKDFVLNFFEIIIE